MRLLFIALVALMVFLVTPKVPVLKAMDLSKVQTVSKKTYPVSIKNGCNWFCEQVIDR